jgi:hypothetical protein
MKNANDTNDTPVTVRLRGAALMGFPRPGARPADCEWCGLGAAFDFYVARDGDAAPRPLAGAFCGSACCRAFHDLG